MNVKTNKTKKQANVENQAVNLLSKEELCKRIEGVEKELKSYTWRELETNGKARLSWGLNRLATIGLHWLHG